MNSVAPRSLLVTGVEVVPLSVANTLYYLWERPDVRRRVVDDPALVAHAYAESLRYDQPTNLLGRFVKDPVEQEEDRVATERTSASASTSASSRGAS